MRTTPSLVIASALFVGACSSEERRASEPLEIGRSSSEICVGPNPPVPESSYSVVVTCPGNLGYCKGLQSIPAPPSSTVSVFVDIGITGAFPVFLGPPIIPTRSPAARTDPDCGDWTITGRAWARSAATGCWTYLGERTGSGILDDGSCIVLPAWWDVPSKSYPYDAAVVQVQDHWPYPISRSVWAGAVTGGTVDAGEFW